MLSAVLYAVCCMLHAVLHAVCCVHALNAVPPKGPPTSGERVNGSGGPYELEEARQQQKEEDLLCIVLLAEHVVHVVRASLAFAALPRPMAVHEKSHAKTHARKDTHERARKHAHAHTQKRMYKAHMHAHTCTTDTCRHTQSCRHARAHAR